MPRIAPSSVVTLAALSLSVALGVGTFAALPAKAAGSSPAPALLTAEIDRAGLADRAGGIAVMPHG